METEIGWLLGDEGKIDFVEGFEDGIGDEIVEECGDGSGFGGEFFDKIFPVDVGEDGKEDADDVGSAFSSLDFGIDAAGEDVEGSDLSCDCVFEPLYACFLIGGLFDHVDPGFRDDGFADGSFFGAQAFSATHAPGFGGFRFRRGGLGSNWFVRLSGRWLGGHGLFEKASRRQGLEASREEKGEASADYTDFAPGDVGSRSKRAYPTY